MIPNIVSYLILLYSAVSDILENSPFVALISEAVTRMEYGNVVDVLYIALLEVGRYAETLTEEMQGIERFRLCFGDWWQMAAARKLPKTNIITPAILEKDPLWRLAICAGRLVIK